MAPDSSFHFQCLNDPYRPWSRARESRMDDTAALPASILVVDDDREMANLLRDVLREAGYNASSANSGADALARVREECPDLLISDVRMSGMSGHQLQNELRELVPDLPVVIITAFGSIESA